jgi:ferrous iron transport protein A
MVLILVTATNTPHQAANGNPTVQDNQVTLDQLNLRQSARVVAVHSDSNVLRRHCVQLGIAPGAPIELLHRALGRGPLQAKVQGALYAIRQEDAAAIEVTV